MSDASFLEYKKHLRSKQLSESQYWKNSEVQEFVFLLCQRAGIWNFLKGESLCFRKLSSASSHHIAAQFTKLHSSQGEVSHYRWVDRLWDQTSILSKPRPLAVCLPFPHTSSAPSWPHGELIHEAQSAENDPTPFRLFFFFFLTQLGLRLGNCSSLIARDTEEKEWRSSKAAE